MIEWPTGLRNKLDLLDKLVAMIRRDVDAERADEVATTDRLAATETLLASVANDRDRVEGERDALTTEVPQEGAKPPEMVFVCKTRATATADPPQDCDWPCCGCDPYAEKVIAALEESGFAIVPNTARHTDIELMAPASVPPPTPTPALVEQTKGTCATCGHPLITHDAGPSDDGCRFKFGWGDECSCGWPVPASPPPTLAPEGESTPPFRAHAAIARIYELLTGAQVRETKRERERDLAKARRVCESSFNAAAILDDRLTAIPTSAPESWQPIEVERWRKFYRALAWMVNDYIGVNEFDVDFRQKHERLGYAHEGYHNARIVMRENKPPMPERLQRFNDGTGCLYGGNSHPDRCVCQEKETGRFAGTPHKHYDEPPYNCARCRCKAYDPAVPPDESVK
jgi:hypothetical protein